MIIIVIVNVFITYNLVFPHLNTIKFFCLAVVVKIVVVVVVEVRIMMKNKKNVVVV